jgi:hypothetical protein
MKGAIVPDGRETSTVARPLIPCDLSLAFVLYFSPNIVPDHAMAGSPSKAHRVPHLSPAKHRYFDLLWEGCMGLFLQHADGNGNQGIERNCKVTMVPRVMKYSGDPMEVRQVEFKSFTPTV